MAPRGRPRSGKTRMDAAIHAMKQFGFDDKVVSAKMRYLLKIYNGQYGFIEDDAYHVLLEALLDQDKEKQVATDGEASNENEIVEGDMAEEAHPVVPTDGLIDIPIASSAPLPAISPPSPLPQLEVASLPLSIPVVDGALPLPPPPPPVMDAALLMPPPPPPAPVMDAALQLPPPPPPPLFDTARLLTPATPLTYATSPPPGFGYQYRRKPCHGWVTDDDEEPEFIRLPSLLDGSISPPSKPAQHEFTVERRYRPRLRSRWDLKPEYM